MSIHDSMMNLSLLHAMESLKNDKSYFDQFMRQLMSVNLYFIVYIEDDINTLLKNDMIDNKLKYRYLGSTDDKGKCMAAFTREEEVGEYLYKNSYKIILLSFAEYFELLLTKYKKYDGIVINPYHQDHVVYKKDMIEYMSKYLDNVEILESEEEREDVLIGLPSKYPKVMIDKLNLYFNNQKTVSKAYLLWMIRKTEEGVEGSYLLIIDSKELPVALFSKLSAICLPYLNGKNIHITLADDSFGKQAIEGYEPFYKRE